LVWLGFPNWGKAKGTRLTKGPFPGIGFFTFQEAFRVFGKLVESLILGRRGEKGGFVELGNHP